MLEHFFLIVLLSCNGLTHVLQACLGILGISIKNLVCSLCVDITYCTNSYLHHVLSCV